MNYQDRKKHCAYCGKEFTFQRVSAKYCSKSCASMDVRRKNNPNAYRHYNPVHLELTDEAYKAIKLKAKEQQIQDPEKYMEWMADEMITKKIYPLLFSEEEENILKYALKAYYPELEFPVALLEWIKNRSEEEAIELKKGKVRKR
jgi:hypothetical protein